MADTPPLLSTLKSARPVRLRDLGLGTRFGLTCLILTLLGGMFVSLVYMREHYANRDEEPELSLRDIEGAYHGASIPAPLLTALERGHPEEMPDADRELLLAWLRAPQIRENYENFDMGPPADLIAINCASCHTRAAAADPASGIEHGLDFAEDVLRIAHTRDMQPTSTKILMQSTHAHATTLALIGVFAVMCLAMSFWPRWLVGLVATLIGLGLLLDVGSWWAARQYREAIYGIVVGGAMFNGGVWLAMGMALVELWRPRFGQTR